MESHQNKVRIISGKWRGRKLSFPHVESIRPTPDRVKETLFNWLSQYINNAVCLDLFSGSGALGFEALSRGAKHVAFVEKNKEIANYLKQTTKLFQAEKESFSIIQCDAFDFLNETASVFDVIFLDPPFNQNLYSKCISIIYERNLLSKNGYIYFETEKNKLDVENFMNFNVVKQSQAGNVCFGLLGF